ncbi:hypothetical protein PILCRDRAFT_17468 [Piloderma croceum F 1598]|uniref:Uncharacterized protein n=1 Tax=Piloderma croceum (strain F 1598) TaxID=765440 RepID=A0A0C3EEC7_PILCF|nr:hypothetical protein PILCRDRAFT_17468 [Piloderma croceum F 1598]
MPAVIICYQTLYMSGRGIYECFLDGLEVVKRWDRSQVILTYNLVPEAHNLSFGPP